MTRNQKIFLAIVAAAALAFVPSLLLYKATEPADREGLRQLFVVTVWVALIAIILAVALTRWVSVREVKAHYDGLDRGLDKVSSQAAKVAETRTNFVTNIKRQVDQGQRPLDDSSYLPRPPQPQVSFRGGNAYGDEVADA